MAQLISIPNSDSYLDLAKEDNVDKLRHVIGLLVTVISQKDDEIRTLQSDFNVRVRASELRCRDLESDVVQLRADKSRLEARIQELERSNLELFQTNSVLVLRVQHLEKSEQERQVLLMARQLASDLDSALLKTLFPLSTKKPYYLRSFKQLLLIMKMPLKPNRPATDAFTQPTLQAFFELSQQNAALYQQILNNLDRFNSEYPQFTTFIDDFKKGFNIHLHVLADSSFRCLGNCSS